MFFNAKEAKEIAIKNREKIISKDFKDIKAAIDYSINDAVAKGLCAARVTKKARFVSTIKQLLADSFLGLGYTVTIDYGETDSDGISELFIEVYW